MASLAALSLSLVGGDQGSPAPKGRPAPPNRRASSPNWSLDEVAEALRCPLEEVAEALHCPLEEVAGRSPMCLHDLVHEVDLVSGIQRLPDCISISRVTKAALRTKRCARLALAIWPICARFQGVLKTKELLDGLGMAYVAFDACLAVDIPLFSLPQLLWHRAGHPSHPAETERMQSGRLGIFSRAKKLSNRGRVMLTIMLMPRVIVTNVETVQFESVNYHLRRGQLAAVELA